MSSEAKTAANRLNAQKSTGPKTNLGKSKSRLNAVTHGIFATAPMLPGEDENAYRALTNAYRKHFAPRGLVEEFLVRQIITIHWKMGRIDRAEVALFGQLIDTQSERLTRSLDVKGLEYALSCVDPDFQISKYQVSKEDPAGNTASKHGRYSGIAGEQFTSADKEFVDRRLRHLVDPGGITLEMLVPGSEIAPQECLDRHRRAMIRDYLVYVAELTRLQGVRRSMLVVAPLNTDQKEALITRTKHTKQVCPKHSANQIDQEFGNEEREQG